MPTIVKIASFLSIFKYSKNRRGEFLDHCWLALWSRHGRGSIFFM